MSTARTQLESPSAACCPSVTEAPLADADAATLAHTYAALADPVRLRLLSLIAASGEMCSCDLVEPLAKSQPTVSHHTKILAEAGLITGDKRGRWVYWSVQPTRADFVRQVLGS
ncbi:metalloregulator ArsR/SmtB family transcription factor [soil metagenome]